MEALKSSETATYYGTKLSGLLQKEIIASRTISQLNQKQFLYTKLLTSKLGTFRRTNMQKDGILPLDLCQITQC